MHFSTAKGNETNRTDNKRGYLSAINQNLIPNHNINSNNSTHPSNAAAVFMLGNPPHLYFSREHQFCYEAKHMHIRTKYCCYIHLLNIKHFQKQEQN